MFSPPEDGRWLTDTPLTKLVFTNLYYQFQCLDSSVKLLNQLQCGKWVGKGSTRSQTLHLILNQHDLTQPGKKRLHMERKRIRCLHGVSRSSDHTNKMKTIVQAFLVHCLTGQHHCLTASLTASLPHRSHACSLTDPSLAGPMQSHQSQPH